MRGSIGRLFTCRSFKKLVISIRSGRNLHFVYLCIRAGDDGPAPKIDDISPDVRETIRIARMTAYVSRSGAANTTDTPIPNLLIRPLIDRAFTSTTAREMENRKMNGVG